MADASSTEKNARPIATPELVLVPVRSRGRIDARDIPAARGLTTHANPGSLTGRVPGSLVLGPLGAYVVGSDGVPVRSQTLGDLIDIATDVVADLTELRSKLAATIADLAAVKLRMNRSFVAPSISPATANGKLKVGGAFTYVLAEASYTKASSLDPIWDLTALATLDGTHYRATWLLIDSSGSGSIASGTTATTSDAAIAALPALDGTKAVCGVFVASPNCNYANALTGQGTVYLGFAAPYVLTATAPAALQTAVPS